MLKIFFYLIKVVYLWVHDKNHPRARVDVSGNKLVCYRVSSIKVKFDKLPVAVGSVQNAPIDPTVDKQK